VGQNEHYDNKPEIQNNACAVAIYRKQRSGSVMWAHQTDTLESGGRSNKS